MVSQLQELKENESTLLAYQDHLEAVVANFTSSNENLVFSHRNMSRSCDILPNETQDLTTEVTESTKEGRSSSKIKQIDMLIFYLSTKHNYINSPM